MEIKMSTFIETILGDDWKIRLEDFGIKSFQYTTVNKKREPVLDENKNKILDWELKHVDATVSLAKCAGKAIYHLLQRQLKVLVQKSRVSMTQAEFEKYIENDIPFDDLFKRSGVTTVEKAEITLSNLPDDQYEATLRRQLEARGFDAKQIETTIETIMLK